MVNILLSVLIAVLLGFLAGMGVGGGSLLLLWLTQVVGMTQPEARFLNLLFYLPAAAASILFRGRRQVPWKMILPGIAAGCIAAALSTVLSRHLNVELLKKLLGVLLIATGLREIFYRPRKAR